MGEVDLVMRNENSLTLISYLGSHHLRGRIICKVAIFLLPVYLLVM